MTNFNDILKEYPFEGTGETYTPYAAKTEDGQWIGGTLTIDFLQINFGQYTTATEMKEATTSEGLKLFFDYLVEHGKVPV
jgi:hypothetical protein